MATNFPTSLDTFTNPNSGNTLDSPSHSIQHSDINDAVEAIEAKIGVGSSTAGSATAGYALVNTSGGTTAYSLLGVSGLSSGTAPIDTFLRADGAGGAAFASVSTTQGLTLLVPSSVSVGGTAATGSVSATGTITFGTATSVSINDVFSATYQNYKVVLTLSNSSTTTNVFMRFRISSSDNSTSNYFYMGTGATSAGGTKPLTAASATQLNLMQRAAITGSIADLTIGYPFSSLHTIIAGTTAAYDGSVYYSNAWGGAFNSATSFTGFTIIGESATLTGQMSVYGVNE
jgi:hypothetical protein